MLLRQVIRSDGKRHAFSLVEIVLALGVFAFCIPVLLALMPIGLNANRFSREKIEAYDLCSVLESDLRATPAGATASPLYGIAVPASGSTTAPPPAVLYDTYDSKGVTFSTTADAASQYRFMVTVVPPATDAPSNPATANIVITWPAQADPTKASTDKASVCVAVNRVGS